MNKTQYKKNKKRKLNYQKSKRKNRIIKKMVKNQIKIIKKND